MGRINNNMTIVLVLVLLVPVIAFGADQKVTALTENTSVAGTDILYIVDDPSGTPASQKITVLNLFDSIDTSAELITIVTDESGSGVLIFGTQPTISSGTITTPTITAGTMATTVISSATINTSTLVRPTVTQSISIPNAANPTTDAAGEIALDTNAMAFEVYDSSYSASMLNSYVEDIDFCIFEPDNVNDEICIFHVDADKYPYGITLLNVQIILPADAAYSMVFEEWSGDPPAAQNDIETVSTGAGDAYMEVGTDNIDDNSIDADDYIFLHVPATDVDWISGKIIFYVKEGN